MREDLAARLDSVGVSYLGFDGLMLWKFDLECGGCQAETEKNVCRMCVTCETSALAQLEQSHTKKAL